MLPHSLGGTPPQARTSLARQSRSARVVILATPGTLDGDLYARVVDEFGQATKITNAPGVGLAELVERGQASSPAARAALREVLGPAIAAGADTVVLGCTHDPFLAGVIRDEFPAVGLVDTSEPVARRAVQVLREQGLEAPAGSPGELDIIVSGDRAAFRAVMESLGFAPVREAVA